MFNAKNTFNFFSILLSSLFRLAGIFFVGQRAHYFPLLSVSKLLCTLAKTKKKNKGWQGGSIAAEVAPTHARKRP
jgi:hypothetical protein